MTETIGAWLGRNMLLRMKIGSVVTPDPAVKVVTMISSKLSAKASNPPARSAERSCGKVTRLNVVQTPAPRSAEASSRLVPMRRRRAMVLLNTVTMQKVACAITTVQIDSGMPMIVRKKLLSAMPVMIPGRAMGRMTSRLTALRPKKSNRCSARDRRVPSTSEMTVATVATCTLVSTADIAPWLWNALTHHSNVNPGGGHVRDVDVEKEFTSTTNSGT